MICFYCRRRPGFRPFVDHDGIGHLSCCTAPSCEQKADLDTARQLEARRGIPIQAFNPKEQHA